MVDVILKWIVEVKIHNTVRSLCLTEFLYDPPLSWLFANAFSGDCPCTQYLYSSNSFFIGFTRLCRKSVKGKNIIELKDPVYNYPDGTKVLNGIDIVVGRMRREGWQ